MPLGVDLDAPPDDLFARKIAARPRIIHEDHQRRLRVVRGGEVPARQDALPHRNEVSWQYRAEFVGRPRLPAGPLVSLDFDGLPEPTAGGKDEVCSHRGHARKRRGSAQALLEITFAHVGVCVRGSGGRKVRGDGAFHVEPG